MTYVDLTSPFAPTWPATWNGPHCTGCRCFANPCTTTTLTWHTEYKPRHRKPGPAQ